MSNYLFWIIFFWVCLESLGQNAKNLIPDGSFEDYQDCPDDFGAVRVGALKYWKATPPDCTPDYFNECSKKFAPSNSPVGKLKPQHGKGYIGLIVRVGASPVQSTDELFYREHIQARLAEPLKHRNRYVFTMYVSLSEYSAYAMSKIGVLFTPTPVLANDKFQASPQIELDFVDTKNAWVKICDTIVAEGGEAYITIGEFSSYTKKDIRKIEEKPENQHIFSYHRAYYFFDNLSLIWLDALPEPMLGTPPMPPFKDTNRVFTGFEKPWQLEPTEFGYLEPNKPIVLKNVLFEFGKATLLEESKYELNKIVRLMREHKDIKIMISGHTDEIGKREDNLKLSDARAKAVFEYLLSQGIEENRLYYTGRGFYEPLADNKTEAGRRKNRRVEFYIIGD